MSVNGGLPSKSIWGLKEEGKESSFVSDDFDKVSITAQSPRTLEIDKTVMCGCAMGFRDSGLINKTAEIH